MHWRVLQVRQHSIQSTMQHKYLSVLITGIGFSASEPEIFFLFLFLADNKNRLKVKICIDFHCLCSCLCAGHKQIIWNEMKKICLQLFPGGNDGLDNGLERVCISTHKDHLEIETVRTEQFFETCTQT